MRVSVSRATPFQVIVCHSMQPEIESNRTDLGNCKIRNLAATLVNHRSRGTFPTVIGCHHFLGEGDSWIPFADNCAGAV